jgi:hypothetical protein
MVAEDGLHDLGLYLWTRRPLVLTDISFLRELMPHLYYLWAMSPLDVRGAHISIAALAPRFLSETSNLPLAAIRQNPAKG